MSVFIKILMVTLLLWQTQTGPKTAALVVPVSARDWHLYWQAPPVKDIRIPHAANMTVNRDLEALSPVFKYALIQLLDQLSQQGWEFVLLEGLRLPNRQAFLWAQGPQVTQAAPHQSLHQRGMAADLAPVRQGRITLDIRDPWVKNAYQQLGEVAQQQGLIWGGRWSMGDYGHVEMRMGPARMSARYKGQ